MNKMTKKEFKKKCKAEKTKTAKLENISKILVCIGFIIALVVCFIGAQTGFSNMSLIIGGGAIAVLFATPGMVLDVVCDMKFSKEYKIYLSEVEK
ncbi:MAG: hypothetical protein E7557_03210 [Ruminococcaceae bacterium]|nr:hypothetical protein [Oscillospiraceae bacterium]